MCVLFASGGLVDQGCRLRGRLPVQEEIGGVGDVFSVGLGGGEVAAGLVWSGALAVAVWSGAHAWWGVCGAVALERG